MSARGEFGDVDIVQVRRATVELRLVDTAARYLFGNLRLLPVLVPATAALLSLWHPIVPLLVWVAATLIAWAAFGVLVFRYQRDSRRGERLAAWTWALGAALALAAGVLVSMAQFFWVEGDRDNNILLYVFVAAGCANAAAQSAPSRFLSAANLLPYCLAFVFIPLLHERAPVSFGFALLGLGYCGLVMRLASDVRQLAAEMLLLREEKRALIERLQTALDDARAAQQHAEAANRAKSQFLANMSHELRTPLNAVLGFSEVIRDRIFGDGALMRYSDYAASIHKSGTHLLGLINDVLDLSKIEAGKFELERERFDLAADAEEALRLVEPQAARKGVELSRETPASLEVFADKRALRQIAVNLLANAVKFTPPGGRVTLSLGRDDSGGVVLGVSDTGIGIRPEDMERVLESFGQGRHDAVAGGERGTGLGLAIARSLAEAHGGRIAIESAPGEGTTVSVTVPQRALEHAA